jgi:hypothetical protein
MYKYAWISEQSKCCPVGEDEHHRRVNLARRRIGHPLPSRNQHEETSLAFDQHGEVIATNS